MSIPAPLPPSWGRGGGCYLLFSSLERRSSERALGELGMCSLRLGTPMDRFLTHALEMIYDGWRRGKGREERQHFCIWEMTTVGWKQPRTG